jgi:glycosyltransferase involved in cell wall biosynthesis
MARTVIVVPCLNEARRLVPDVFRDFIHDQPMARVLFVDDGSTDGTTEVLGALVDSRPESFEVLRLPANRGKAEAVRTGFLQAFRHNPEFVGFWDADLATPLTTLSLFEEMFGRRPETEIVLGARVQLLGRDIRRKVARHYSGRVFATAVSVVLGLAVYDTQCGAKLFKTTERVRAIFEQRFLSRWVFDVEILARFLERVAPHEEVSRLLYELPLPVWHDVPGSKLRWSDFARAAMDLSRIYVSHRLPMLRRRPQSGCLLTA